MRRSTDSLPPIPGEILQTAALSNAQDILQIAPAETQNPPEARQQGEYSFRHDGNGPVVYKSDDFAGDWSPGVSLGDWGSYREHYRTNRSIGVKWQADGDEIAETGIITGSVQYSMVGGFRNWEGFDPVGLALSDGDRAAHVPFKCPSNQLIVSFASFDALYTTNLSDCTTIILVYWQGGERCELASLAHIAGGNINIANIDWKIMKYGMTDPKCIYAFVAFNGQRTSGSRDFPTDAHIYHWNALIQNGVPPCRITFYVGFANVMSFGVHADGRWGEMYLRPAE